MANKLLKEYLNQSNSRLRIEILGQMKSKGFWLPISLANDLLCLRLNDEEKIAIIHATSSRNNLAFEDFLTRNVGSWNQNLASFGLWEWANRSERILWHRSIPLSIDERQTQRVHFTLLDLAWYGGGSRIVENLARMDGLEDLSDTFLSLLFERSLQWNVKSDRLIEKAKEGLLNLGKKSFIIEKTHPYYLAYLYRYDGEGVKSLSSSTDTATILSQFHGAASLDLLEQRRVQRIMEACQQKYSKAKEKTVLSLWPLLWERHKIESESLLWVFNQLSLDRFQEITEDPLRFFQGIPSKTLLQALENCSSASQFLAAFTSVGHLIHTDHRDSLLDLIKAFAATSENPADFISQIPQRFSISLNVSPSGTSAFHRIHQEQNQILKHDQQDFLSIEDVYTEMSDNDPDALVRHNFFNLAYRSMPLSSYEEKGSWWKLIKIWQNPQEESLQQLGQEARQAPAVFKLCFLETLGRFEGIDAAALKILDYIRSKDNDVLETAIYALGGIKTTRAAQELVAFLTRPNASFPLRMKIITILQSYDLTRLQPELRSAINDLRFEEASNPIVTELREGISLLLSVEDQTKAHEFSQEGDTTTTEILDALLSNKFKDFNRLSGEARRALRTAQFFDLQVENTGNLNTIDLSPAIDMQYKALELSFREKFEECTSALIRKGVLQRRLDVIGYARPIPRAMEEFETYIENLPTINSIPFFSRFKLRKMLRAICQYKPGRRFTLDGLKAFALFLICFSRKQCRYGLENLFPVPDLSDEELFYFCKTLHVFQDFRNRAAHEGFHPDASQNLDTIWKETAKIIDTMVKLEDIINQAIPANTLHRGA